MPELLTQQCCLQGAGLQSRTAEHWLWPLHLGSGHHPPGHLSPDAVTLNQFSSYLLVKRGSFLSITSARDGPRSRALSSAGWRVLSVPWLVNASLCTVVGFHSLAGQLVDKCVRNLLGKSFSGQHTPLGPDVLPEASNLQHPLRLTSCGASAWCPEWPMPPVGGST